MIFIAWGGDNLFCSTLRRMDVLLTGRDPLPCFSIIHRHILEWPSDWRSLHLFDGIDKCTQLAQSVNHTRGNFSRYLDLASQMELFATRYLKHRGNTIPSIYLNYYDVVK